MSAVNDKRPSALIADDDELSRLLLQETTEQAGFDTVAVADGTDALQAALSRHFDIALLDVEMPGLDGYAVCRALRCVPTLRHLPVVMITGHDSAQSIEKSYEAGATDFISKPLNWSLIPHRLRYILRNAEAENRIRELAYRDPLTALPNRQAFMDLGSAAIDAVNGAVEGQEFALLRLDVEACSRINENFGPLVGDSAVRGFALRLAQCAARFGPPRATANVARFDGDQFVVSVQGKDAIAAASELAAAIATAFAEPITCDDHRFFLRPSLGMSQFPDHGTDVATLLMHADTAKHQARASGSSDVVVYTNEMSARARERMALDAELRYAVRNEQLTLHFQPKIRIADGCLVGVEALLRWFHPELGPISPVRFIPLAEDSELILEMGRWVLRAACRQLRAWQDAGLSTTIAVNVSGKQFVHDDPAREIAAAAADSGVHPSQIIVEITESMVMSDLAPVQAGLAATRRLGCRVAVDDFGTGSSSLAYLRELPIDELKVDRLFVERVDANPVDAAIFAAVLSLARSLSLPVTAEGVETAAQLEWLRAHGCDQAQGYLLARPMEGYRILELYGPAQRKDGVQVA